MVSGTTNLARMNRAIGAAMAAFVLGSATARAAEVSVFAAASLTDALKQIAAKYERQSGDQIRFNLGASSTLARQIAAGAPADLFFSADEARWTRLQSRD